MEIQEGGHRYELIRHNAQYNNMHLDTRFKIDSNCVEDAVNHLDDCTKNPTVALLARKKARSNNYPEFFKRNLNDIYKLTPVRDAYDIFRTKFSFMYPKTGKARKLLINTESIVLNYVKPIKKDFKRTVIKLLCKI